MSNAKQNNDDGTVASRSQKQTRIRARDEEEEGDDKQPQQSAQASAHVSPAMRLYRHALESIFAMLELGDLSRVLAVSRSFAAAVRSMAPISGSIERDERAEWKPFRLLPPIEHIVGPPLLRHLVAVHISNEGWWTPLTDVSLGLLAHHTPNLTSLWCNLTLKPNASLILPAKLQSLNLQLGDDHADAAINGVLTALAALPGLAHLSLKLKAFARHNCVDLRLLAACPSLADLSFDSLRGGRTPGLTLSQTHDVCDSLAHLHRCCIGEWTDSDILLWYLDLPDTARWQDIGRVHGDEHSSEILLRLPMLTKLDLTYDKRSVDVAFLPELTNLTSLKFACYNPDHEDDDDDDHEDENETAAWFVPADALLASLVRCTILTDLNLACGFNSAHWSALFAKLTAIKKLTIDGGELETLQCFATGPITESLEELTTRNLNLPPSEISHLYALLRLRILDLDRCFSTRLFDATLTSLFPPTPVLPALTQLFHRWWDGSGEFASIKRRGLSFEWMQQWLTR